MTLSSFPGESKVHVPPPFLPGFAASLRLLVERERYSLVDIGMMFGVSRERARQWCKRIGVVHPDTYNRGLMAVRVWDDVAHRFQPVPRGTIARRKARESAAVARAHKRGRRAARQEDVTVKLVALQSRLCREPTWFEMLVELKGHTHVQRGSATPIVLGMWDSSTRPTRDKLRDFRAATGIEARARGGAGHIPRLRREVCKRAGHPLRETPKGQRYCPACATVRDKRRYDAAKALENAPSSSVPSTGGEL